MGRATKKSILKAIEGSNGIVSNVASSLGCAWVTAKNYIESTPQFKEKFLHAREALLDIAENAISTSIKDGNTQDAKWLLSTLGKKRGFVEKSQLELSGEIKTFVDYVTEINKNEQL